MISLDLTWDDYLAIPKMNPSTLVAGCHSMKRLKRVIEGGFKEETDAMRFGTGLHALLLEPEEFQDRFCVVPDFHLDADNVTAKGVSTDSKVTTYCKGKVAEFAAANKGKKFLSQQQYDDCKMAIESLRSRSAIKEIIESSETEVTLSGEILGVPCKGRLDLLRVDSRRGLITDLKTTASVDKHMFGRVFMRMRYDFKMAFYRELVRQQTGEVYNVSVICQEPSGDFDNALVPVPAIVLDNAMTKVYSVMQDYIKARDSDFWPGVDGGRDEYELAIPNWAMEDEDDEPIDWAKLPQEGVAF
jgi:exodeoxyribonuclease VIII